MPVLGRSLDRQVFARKHREAAMIHPWKKALLEGAAGIFERGGQAAATAKIAEDTVRNPHARIGDLAVANVFCHESSSPGSGSEAGHD